MNKVKEEILKMSKNMDWPTALNEIERVIALHVSSTVSKGEYSREAYRRAWKTRAAWERIQRG